MTSTKLRNTILMATTKLRIVTSINKGSTSTKLSVMDCISSAINYCITSLGTTIKAISNQVGNNTNTSYVTYIKKVLTHQVVVCYA